MSRKIQLVYLILTLFFCISNVVQAQETTVHTVEQGQTAYSIAKFHNITVDDLKKYNPTLDDSYALKLGQKLTIPVLKSKEPVLVTENRIHKVKEDETLYSISTKYGVTVDQIKEWNKLNGNSIKLDQELIIGTEKVELKPKLTENKTIRKSAITHVVEQEETVYSLSKKYNTAADSIVKWNKIIDNNIRPGQNLIIGWNERTITTSDSAPRTVESVPSSKPKVVNRAGNSSRQNKQSVLQERYNLQTNKKQTEGAGIWFETENTMMNSTYYGLFNDTKVGSIVKVTNLMNNRSVYVKVIGSLPDTAENEGATIKLTPACKSVLQNNDGKLRVRITHQ